MKRVAVLLGILALALAPCTASAQDFFGFGPYFGLGGTSCCGDEKPKSPCTFYVGYSGDPHNSTAFNLTTTSGTVLGAVSLDISTATRGVLLGASKAVSLSDRVGLVGSFWYLFPDKTKDTEMGGVVAGGALASQTWNKTSTQWWFADLLGAFDSGDGFSFLAGFRYDYYTSRYSDPKNVIGFATVPGDTADVRSNGYIPLIGGQAAFRGTNSRGLVRLVGFPYLVGSLKFSESFTAAATAIEGTGNYNGKYFLEVFAEYAYTLGGTAYFGLFGRFNSTHGTTNFDVTGTGVAPVQNATFKLGLERNVWTVGGMFDLRF